MATYETTIKSGDDELLPRTRTLAITDSSGTNLQTVLNSIDTNKVTNSTQTEIETAIDACF